jgi:hypothetical protein
MRTSKRIIKIVDSITNYDINHKNYGQFIEIDRIETDAPWDGYGWNVSKGMAISHPKYLDASKYILIDITDNQTVLKAIK